MKHTIEINTIDALVINRALGLFVGNQAMSGIDRLIATDLFKRINTEVANDLKANVEQELKNGTET